MASCELCGKPATTKARIEGVLFSVCAGCATLGNELKDTPRQSIIKQQTRPATYAPRPAAQGTETYLATDYSQRLRKARMKMGLNEKDAAMKMNIREIELLHYESGKLQPNDAAVKKLEKFYGISLYDSA